MTDLRSAPVPPLEPDDHVRAPDGAPLVVMYGDYTCPHCITAYLALRERDDVRLAFRHFALKARHPRAPALAAAAEAAAMQDAFWPFHDALLADPGRLDDPHLWDRARALELDLDRFELDRRSDTAAERVSRDVTGGLRAGVAGTPALAWDGAIQAPGATMLRFGF